MSDEKKQGSEKDKPTGELNQSQGGAGFDAAGKSLANALKSSFVILKGIMILLVILFLFSGFKTVGPDENALVLLFGRIQGSGEERVLKPGLHWMWPQPIQEIVRIPVFKKVDLPVNSFWYFQRDTDILPQGPRSSIRVPPTLDPVHDGYCITRNEKLVQAGASSGDDYSIVHCKWQLTYNIDDPERFYKNVYVADLSAGEIYFDVVRKNVEPFLTAVFEDSVVTAMVNYTIDEAIQSYGRIPGHVQKLMQDKLDAMESGIKIESVRLTQSTWPRQVDAAFQASITATQTREKSITEARTYAENTLSQAGGSVAAELLDVLHGQKKVNPEEEELLWSQLAGQSQEVIAQARSYRTRVAESTRASVEYLQQILPEYKNRPELVVQKIYQDAIEEVLNNVQEKMIIKPTAGTKGSEIRIMLNRDPTIKPQTPVAPK